MNNIYISSDTLIECIQNNGMDKFLLGEKPYYFVSNVEYPEPQNIDAAFNAVLYKAWEDTKDIRIPDSFLKSLLSIITTPIDVDKSIYCACNWITCYCSAMDDNLSSGGRLYGNLFKITLDDISEKLRLLIELSKEALKRDTRWSGEKWNSSDGLWTPTVRQAILVRDTLNGPDFVPRNV